MFEVVNGFRVWTSKSGRALVGLESNRLSHCLQLAADGAVDGVVVSRYHGYEESDLACLLSCLSIRSLYVVDPWPDLSSIEKLRNLEWLQVEGAVSTKPLRLSAFQKLEELRASWWPNLHFEGSSETLRSVFLGDFRPDTRDCSELTELRSLHKLEICGSNVQSLDGLNTLAALEELYLLECRALSDIAALRARAASLKQLTLGHCRKIDPVSDVRVLSELRSLSYYACAEIPSLEFIREMPKLTHLSFLKTKIGDGDLNPVLGLVRVNFENARGLSHSYAAVSKIIASRRA